MSNATIYWPPGTDEEGRPTGYPQNGNVHPQLPWWRLALPAVVDPSRGTVTLRRVDGRNVTVPINMSGTYKDEVAAVLPKLVAYDRAHPLSPPPPKVGQVWRCRVGSRDGGREWVRELDVSIVRVIRESGMPECVVVAGHHSPAAWNNLDFDLLLAGPHAPWAHPSYLDTLSYPS